MRKDQEPFSEPFPTGFAILALGIAVWIFGPANSVQQERTTVRAKNYATIKAPKQGLIPVWMLEESIEARLRERPAKFKR